MSVVDLPSSFMSPPDGSCPASFYSSLPPLPARCQPYTSETPPEPPQPIPYTPVSLLPVCCLLAPAHALHSYPPGWHPCHCTGSVLSLWSPSRMAFCPQKSQWPWLLILRRPALSPLSSLKNRHACRHFVCPMVVWSPGPLDCNPKIYGDLDSRASSL